MRQPASSTGGSSLVEMSAELRYRATNRLGYVVFVDAGAAADDVEPPIDEMRAGAGIGVRYYAGFGPLRADIAVPLNKREGDADVPDLYLHRTGILMDKARRRKIPLWARIAIGVAAALLALVAAGVVLRYWITSDGGRAFIVSADRRSAHRPARHDSRRGPGRAIRWRRRHSLISRWSTTTASGCAPGMHASNGRRRRCSPASWRSRRSRCGWSTCCACRARPTRANAARRPTSGSSLDEVIIDELHIADNVLGPTAASYRISGGAARGRDGAGFARLEVAPLSGPADRIDASAEWTAEGALGGKAAVAGPPGGLVAILIQAPAGAEVTLTGSIDGTITDFTGGVRLTFADQPVAVIDVRRKGDAAHVSASLATDIWPLLEPIAKRTGGRVSLEGDADLTDTARIPLKARLASPAGEVDISGHADLEDMRLLEDVSLETRGLDLAFVAPPLKGRIDASGKARLVGLTDFVWEGQATATGLEYPSGAIARASSPITIRKDRSTISWELARARIEGGRVTPLKSLAPASYIASTRGEVNLATRTVEVSQAQIVGAPGQATGRGVYTISTGAFEYSGAASFNHLADFAPLTGSARGQWSVRRASHAAPIRISADAAGRNVSSRMRILADLAGASPNAKITGVVSSWALYAGVGVIPWRGSHCDHDRARRRQRRCRRPRNRIAAAARSPCPAPPSSRSASPPTCPASSRRPVSTSALRTARSPWRGSPSSDVVGEAEARLGDEGDRDFSLSGGSWDQPVRAAGRFEASGGDWRIANLDARAGEVTITAPRVSYADGIFTTTFDASGSLSGLAGLDRGTLTARGTITSGDDLDIDVSGQLANLRSGTVRVELLSFDADASDDRATLTGRLKGSFGAPVDLAFDGSGRRANETWSGVATLEGSIDKLPVATSRPANWSYGADAWLIDGELAAFGGRIDANARSSREGASAAFDVADLDLRALSRLARITPIDGRRHGQVHVLERPGRRDRGHRHCHGECKSGWRDGRSRERQRHRTPARWPAYNRCDRRGSGLPAGGRITPA